MRDIIIKPKQIWYELRLIILLYLIANLINLFSIIGYGTSWSELFTSQIFVLIVTEWLYLLSVLVRLIVWMIKSLRKK